MGPSTYLVSDNYNKLILTTFHTKLYLLCREKTFFFQCYLLFLFVDIYDIIFDCHAYAFTGILFKYFLFQARSEEGNIINSGLYDYKITIF